MYLTRDRIENSDRSGDPEDFHSGAEVIFLGKVRNHSQGRKALYLEYEAYESMAESMFEDLVLKVKTLWSVDAVKVLHRLGRVGLGEIAVSIKVFSAHRDEAYQASRFLIEEIKHRIPIWKKEYFENGTSEWGVCSHEKPVPVS